MPIGVLSSYEPFPVENSPENLPVVLPQRKGMILFSGSSGFISIRYF